MNTTVMVFRKGFSKVVKGVQCDVERIDFNDLDKYLSEGWKRSLEEVKEKSKGELEQQIKPKRKRRTRAEMEAAKEA